MGAIGSESGQQSASASTEAPRAPRIPGNRVAASVIAGLIVVMVIGGILVTKGGGTNVNEGSRLVIVPTADKARTVIVTPCATGAKVTSHNALAVLATTGSTALSLPQGQGTRLVIVPPCTAATSGLPSAAFLLRPGTPVPSVNAAASSSSASSSSASSASSQAAAPSTVESQLIVPPGSDVRTVVVPPCVSSKAPPQVILSTQASGTDTAVAPSC